MISCFDLLLVVMCGRILCLFLDLYRHDTSMIKIIAFSRIIQNTIKHKTLKGKIFGSLRPLDVQARRIILSNRSHLHLSYLHFEQQYIAVNIHNNHEFHRIMPACWRLYHGGCSPCLSINVRSFHVSKRQGVDRQRHTCHLSRIHREAGASTMSMLCQ